MLDTYALVRQAIIDKNQVVGTYDGHRREMCPHIIGIKRNGNRSHRNALFYQFGGTSESGLEADGSPRNWRCIPVDELSDVVVHSGPWHTAPNYTRPQTCVDEIDVEVSL
jgi:hypothetical protein